MEQAKRQRVDSVTTGSGTQSRVAVVPWHELPQELIPSILSHYDVQTLIEKKRVCRNWKQMCTNVIIAKRRRAFQTNEELKDAVNKYCRPCNPEEAEEIAEELLNTLSNAPTTWRSPS